MVQRSAGAMALLFFTIRLSAQSVDAGQQLYRTHCFVCHGQEGESIPGVSFRSGQFRRASNDEELSRIVLNGIPGTGMPPTNLNVDERRSLVAYLRSMHDTAAGAKGVGDAGRGTAIFSGKGGCLNCHRTGSKGSRLGPDLSEIGSLRNGAYLEKSLVDPNETIAPQNRFVHAVTKDGVVINGRRLNEDTHSIQLIDEKERLVSLSKADLREFTLVKTSPMPSYKDKLSSQEITDLVSYLLSLKGSQ
jgi:putative heme-binding domain-containing protein